MTHPFFGTSLRRDPEQSPDLHARIDAQLAERLEEAVDFVCLDALVQSRRAHGLSAPVADSEADRAEFTTSVGALLARLERELLSDLTIEDQRRLRQRAGGADGEHAALKLQVLLARERPDYWQRFDAVREAYTAEYVAHGDERRPADGSRPRSRRERSPLGRLFSRG